DRDIGSISQLVAEGEEVADHVGSLAVGQRGAIVNADARAAAEPRGNDEIGMAVAVDIAERGSRSAAEARIGDAEEVRGFLERAPFVNLDARATALVRRDDEFRLAVAVDVARGYEHAALERVER